MHCVNASDNIGARFDRASDPIEYLRKVRWEQRRVYRISGRAESCQTPAIIDRQETISITCIARFESLKNSVRGRFVHVGTRYELRWCEIETAYIRKSYIDRRGDNSNHIEPRRFLKDSGDVVLEWVRDIIERHGSMKVNTASTMSL